MTAADSKMICETLAAIFASLLTLVFLFAAYSKIRYIDDFKNTLEALNVKSYIRHFVIFAVPISECVIGLMLLLNIQAQLAGVLATAMLIVFCLFIVYLIKQKKKVRCSCFGKSDDVIGVGTLIRNGLLVVMSLWIALWGGASYTLVYHYEFYLLSLCLICVYLSMKELVSMQLRIDHNE